LVEAAGVEPTSAATCDSLAGPRADITVDIRIGTVRPVWNFVEPPLNTGARPGGAVGRIRRIGEVRLSDPAFATGEL